MNFIAKLLNNFRTSATPAPTPAEDAASVPEAVPAVVAAVADPSAVQTEGHLDLHGFVNHVVGALVDAGTPFAVTAEEAEGRLVLRIQCPTTQVGRIIGKNGKTIEAIRLLVRDAASRQSLRAKVVVAEQR